MMMEAREGYRKEGKRARERERERERGGEREPDRLAYQRLI